jgi:hypothetical protein
MLLSLLVTAILLAASPSAAASTTEPADLFDVAIELPNRELVLVPPANPAQSESADFATAIVDVQHLADEFGTAPS